MKVTNNSNLKQLLKQEPESETILEPDPINRMNID